MTFTTLIGPESLRELLSAVDGPGATTPGTGAPVATAPGHPVSGRPLVLLDCRFDLNKPDAGRDAYTKGHIPGAGYADLNLHLSSPVTAASGRHPLPLPGGLREFFSSLGIGNRTQVVAYDDANSSFAARAWWLLRWLGHTRVAVLDGGLKGWVANGGAVESGEPPAGTAQRDAAHASLGWPGVPSAAPDGRPWLSTADVARALGDSGRLLVDARAPERFAGSVEPLDSVAGHVPGAVNHPFSSNLGSDGRFLPAAELRRRWRERLAGTAPENVILMCGSGVTACHNALAMEIAGLPGAPLYAGSWSEWIRDPERATERGNPE